MLIAAALLAVALSTALAPVPLRANQLPVRVIHFAGGEAIIERHGAEEHVVVKRHGQIASISDCDTTSGTYDQIVQFSATIKRAARDRNRGSIASLMTYPLQVNTGPGKSRFVPSKQALLSHFDSIFGTQVMRSLGELEAHEVFCRDGRSMLADGTLWATVNSRGKLRATVLNAK